MRSLPDCLAMARTDFPSRTSMQQARFLVGDRRLFNRFRKVLAENVYQKDFAQFLETTLAERDQRYRKFGGSPYMGEPNVKESAGGLRDLHTAMWLASTKFGARTLRDLLEKRLITQREERLTDAALTFLWRVRNELHFLSGHKNDVLSRDIQPQIAKRFGYESDENSLDVEKFMRDYYLHARVIHRVSSRLIARCQETLSRRGTVQRRLRQEALADCAAAWKRAARQHPVDDDRGRVTLMTLHNAKGLEFPIVFIPTYIGYDKGSEIVKEAAQSGRSLREVAREAGVLMHVDAVVCGLPWALFDEATEARLLTEVGHIVRACHERYDGRGYPDGIVGEEIDIRPLMIELHNTGCQLALPGATRRPAADIARKIVASSAKKTPG